MGTREILGEPGKGPEGSLVNRAQVQRGSRRIPGCLEEFVPGSQRARCQWGGCAPSLSGLLSVFPRARLTRAPSVPRLIPAHPALVNAIVLVLHSVAGSTPLPAPDTSSRAMASGSYRDMPGTWGAAGTTAHSGNPRAAGLEGELDAEVSVLSAQPKTPRDSLI